MELAGLLAMSKGRENPHLVTTSILTMTAFHWVTSPQLGRCLVTVAQVLSVDFHCCDKIPGKMSGKKKDLSWLLVSKMAVLGQWQGRRNILTGWLRKASSHMTDRKQR